MKLLTLFGPVLLAATAYASDPESASSAASEATPSESPAQVQDTAPPIEDPPTAGALWSPRWTKVGLDAQYTIHCRSTATFTASVYKLKEMYPTLKDYAPQLKVFYNKQVYPGSWDGVDVHGDQRELLKMGYEELPYGMREWLKEHPKQRMFSHHKEEGGAGVVFFAPGAISPMLPAWVDESEEKGCEGIFEDLDNYSVTPKDGAVLGRIEHKSTGKNEVEITVEAFVVRQRETGRDEL